VIEPTTREKYAYYLGAHILPVFAAWGRSEQAELAELVVTELATNALRHGTGPIGISLCYSGHDLRTEVHDHGTGRPVRRQTTADDEQGRGLELLDGLIDFYARTI